MYDFFYNLISILLHEISIWYNRKIELNIWYRNLCLQLQRSDVSCSSGPGLHTLLAHSSVQVFSRSFRFWGCRWVTQTFSSLHRCSVGFRSGDWLGHSFHKHFINECVLQLRAILSIDISALDQRVATPVAPKARLRVIVLSAVLRNARDTITTFVKMTRRKRS